MGYAQGVRNHYARHILVKSDLVSCKHYLGCIIKLYMKRKGVGIMLKERRIKRNFVGAGIGVFVTVASLTGCVSGNGSNTNVANNKEVSKVEATQEPTATPEVTPVPTESPEEKERREWWEKLPIEKRAAIEAAISYVYCCDMSPIKLYDQLIFEGFSEEDSEFAVNHIDTDFDEECYNAAYSYVVNIGGFSKQGLINQLVFEGFTEEQAKKAVKRLGY